MHSSSSYHAFVIDLRGGDAKPILPKVSDILIILIIIAPDYCKSRCVIYATF